ncbi:hypothetical protein [Chryseobacterium sp.]|uniref:hypothetical protein n=1 Tax=Chryseobacterium sp. TaxID=1871047 RepID=UPI00321B22AE
MKNIILILTLSFFLFSCKKNKENNDLPDTKNHIAKVTDTTLINGVLLELMENNGKAELRVNSKTYTLSGNIKVNPPCYFLRNGNKKSESFSYPDIKVDHTLIILGNIEKQDSDKICGKGLQGIIFKNDSIIITSKTLQHSFACADTGTDEKNFWGFAHD